MASGKILSASINHHAGKRKILVTVEVDYPRTDKLLDLASLDGRSVTLPEFATEAETKAKAEADAAAKKAGG